MSKCHLRAVAVICLAHFSASVALAQWSTDPLTNDPIALRPSDQNQPKVVTAPGGGFWTAWLDGIATGWDVRVQRFGAGGAAVLAPGGVLVADRSFSSTQDYGLDVAPNGDALLAFRDDSGTGVEVSAARVDATGSVLWSVPLTAGAGFVASPKIAALADGSSVVAWTENSTVRLQRLDAGGAPLWAAPVTLAPAAGSYSLAAARADGLETVVSMVRQAGGFTSPRNLVAQRFDASGAPLWGAQPIAVFDGGSLQIGNFPPFSLDAAGGALFAWYSSSPALQCRVQLIDAAGNERFAHDGVEVATAPGRVRVNPTARLDAASGEVVVAWKEQNATQSQSGISVQRVSAAGVRLLGDSGATVVPVGTSGADFPIVLAVDGAGTFGLAWEESPSFGADRVYGARIDASGAFATPRFDVASTPSAKLRYAVALTLTGDALAVWSDGRNDGGDIYGAFIGADGTLGGSGSIGTPICTAATNSMGQAATLVAQGSTSVALDDVTLVAATLPPFQFGLFIVGQSPGSTPNPGTSQGKLCLSGSIGRYLGPGQVQSSGPTGSIELALDLAVTPTPNTVVAIQPGETWYFQAWYRDFNPTSTANFTPALRIDFQ